MEETDWALIDTVPKDGTRVLLGRFTGEGKNHDGHMAMDRYNTPVRGGYAQWTGFGCFNETYWPATHWRYIKPPTL